ncbi:MAG: YifB family Mg chelatase-like AAA ATPase [Pseudomonadales bacterium]|nr:YifB family Mg chelatase-like AAA ATPase [Candidatus Woesebacteria bacterium]MCB9802269.1 YifB family Mg chelatase-like AAA ATPase [Pseudomonadales bacterium]
MLSRTYTATTLGFDPLKIEVEVDAVRGAPNLVLIGLPSKAVDESKERITAALLNNGFYLQSKRTVVNLAPADIRKDGSAFELAIAVGLLKLYGYITKNTDDTMFFGELSLDGSLKAVRGALPLVLAARDMGLKQAIIPAENAREVALVEGVEIIPAGSVAEVVAFFNNTTNISPLTPTQLNRENITHEVLISDVKGQELAKRALVIAAAGGHNVFLNGAPGSGKSMLARAFRSLLPPLEKTEVLAVTAIHSITGANRGSLVTHRPFRSPHHTTSDVGLIGGGSKLKPGEISLAHRGVLFLDEFPEFSRSALESLRQPLEDGNVTISRSVGSTTYPAKFTLVAAANPCPCGWYGSGAKPCTCSDHSRAQYQRKLSGPILDRIDLHIAVRPVEIKTLRATKTNKKEQKKFEESISIALERQKKRLSNTPYTRNAEIISKDIHTLGSFEESALTMLAAAAETLSLSARSYFKMMKVALTIADLEQADSVTEAHIAESLQFRN